MFDTRDHTWLAEQDKRHHLHPMTNPAAHQEAGPDMIVRAEGIYLYTADGRKLIDAGAGLGNVLVGYGNSRLSEAAFKVMKQMSFGHALRGRSNPWAAALSAKLADITPAQYQHFYFASTGSDAIETSIKLALRHWRVMGKPAKRAIISRHGSYHGNTLFAASLTGFEIYHEPFGLPVTDLVHYADSPYWYREGKGRSPTQFGLEVARALERQILEIGPDNVAAFVGDPIQTWRVIIPPASYWPEVRRICNQYDILLISDEVISGFGKTGRMFGFQNFDFEPDLIVMAKGISSGYFPISCVAVGEKVGAGLRSGSDELAHVFTNCGHPVGAAVALENISLIEEEGLIEKVRTEIGPYFHKKLSELLEFPCVGEIRALGVMGWIEIDLGKAGRASSQEADAAFMTRVLSIARARGLVTHGFCLPMIITKDQVDDVVGILRDALSEAVGAN